MMEDPIQQNFDLIVLGTGIVTSAIAAAAAKNGKTVVQIDANDFYGSFDASLPLGQFLDFANSLSTSSPGDESSNNVDLCKEVPIPNEWNDSTVIDAKYNRSDSGLKFIKVDPIPESLEKSTRRIIIDLVPRLNFSRGLFTNMLVNSNVASYLEYKPLDAMFILKEHSIDSNVVLTAHGLPASKGDIFLNKDLSLLDKHQLMKYFLFAQDQISFDEQLAYPLSEFLESVGFEGVANLVNESTNSAERDVLSAETLSECGDNVEVPGNLGDKAEMRKKDRGTSQISDPTYLNEKRLGSGRSLLRPQNKVVDDLDYPKFSRQEFSSFLANLGASRSGPLSTVLQGVLLGPPSMPTDQAVVRTRAFISSLGIHGPSPFLASLYGSGEAAQAFCRLGAVKGGIYVLDAAPLYYKLSRDELKSQIEVEGSVPQSKSSGTKVTGVLLSNGVALRGRAVLGEPSYLRCFSSSKSLSRGEENSVVTVVRVSVTRRPLLPVADGGAGVAVAVLPSSPSSSFCSEGPLFILQESSAVAVVPEGFYLLYAIQEGVQAESGAINAAASRVTNAFEALITPLKNCPCAKVVDQSEPCYNCSCKKGFADDILWSAMWTLGKPIKEGISEVEKPLNVLEASSDGLGSVISTLRVSGDAAKKWSVPSTDAVEAASLLESFLHMDGLEPLARFLFSCLYPSDPFFPPSVISAVEEQSVHHEDNLQENDECDHENVLGVKGKGDGGPLLDEKEREGGNNVNEGSTNINEDLDTTSALKLLDSEFFDLDGL